MRTWLLLIDKSSAETPGHEKLRRREPGSSGMETRPADTLQPKALNPVVNILLKPMILYMCACVIYDHKHLCAHGCMSVCV